MLPRLLTIRRDDGLTRDVKATTPESEPNIYIQTITPVLAVGIRALRSFYAAFSGAFLASVGGVDAFETATVGDAFQKALLIGLMAGIVSAVTNTGEILAKLDQKFPTLRA